MRLSIVNRKKTARTAAKPKRKTTNYRRGVICEYRARDILRELGYLVIRAAGSHGPFDLSAIHYDTGAVLLVQVKRGRLTKTAKDAIVAEYIPKGARAELWQFNGRNLARWRVYGGALDALDGQS